MSADWQFYFCTVDDQPASIFLNLEQTPDARLSHLGVVRVTMRSPRPDGLSSQEEAPELYRLEDALEADLLNDRTLLVGRLTSGGFRDFFFYLDEDDGWEQRVKIALRVFAAYEVDVYFRPDADWSVFRDFLYPDDEQRQSIENGKMGARMEELGDRLEQAREIDHWINFSSETAMREFETATEALGFRRRGTTHHSEDELPFSLQIYRVDVPSYAEIDAVTLPLFRLAKEHGGDYDGWETQVVQ